MGLREWRSPCVVAPSSGSSLPTLAGCICPGILSLQNPHWGLLGRDVVRWRWEYPGVTHLLCLQKAKFTFLRCAILLKWEFRKELFSKLAWGQGLGAEYDVFIYMVRCGHSGRWAEARE